MLLPQVLCHLISATKSRSMALRAHSDGTEVKSLSSTMDSILVADAVRVPFEGLGAA